MVDLHAHTDRSDGALAPHQLIDLALRKGLKALSITDHDTLAGYDAAGDYARQAGLELICGVELSTKLRKRSMHILGYFLEKPPDQVFRDHLACVQTGRQERNARLARRLQQLGLDVHLEEAERLGQGQTGRPHFAQVLVKKNYTADIREAFDRYLDESAPGYVERRDPSLENVLRWVHEAGGIACWAHPARFFREAGLNVEETFARLAEKGLHAIEIYHTDHLGHETEMFRAAAAKLGLGMTGGSDFHGPAKPHAELGGLRLPMSLLEDLRTYSRKVHGAAHHDLDPKSASPRLS